MGYNLLIHGVYLGYNPWILTFDPSFQRDIQVVGRNEGMIRVIHGYDGNETSRNFPSLRAKQKMRDLKIPFGVGYTYLQPIGPLFCLRKKVFSNQNKDHLGSRYPTSCLNVCPLKFVVPFFVAGGHKFEIHRKTRGKTVPRWWFQICFMFTPIWGRFPI